MDDNKQVSQQLNIELSEEIAQGIYYLSSPESSWTTGASLLIDGGLSLTQRD